MSTVAVSTIATVAIVISVTSRTHVAVGGTIIAAAVITASMSSVSACLIAVDVDTRRWEYASQLVELSVRWRA
jgi:hypothetical protein